jgi:putative FmdB family regulatory protein
MIYTFACESCNGSFEVNIPIADREKPISQPCQLCEAKGKVYRVFDSTGFIYTREGGTQKAAGSGWNDVLKSIHKASGSESTINA